MTRRPSNQRRTASILVVLASVASAASLTGCAGHGNYTQDRVNAAAARMAQLKSGTEWQMAQQQYLAGDLDKALKTIDRSIALNDQVPKSHTLRGRILIEKGRLEEARQSFLNAEKIDETFVDAQYYLGIVHERFNEPEPALARYERAMKLEPTNAQYVIAASEMLVHLGRVDDAETLLNERRSDFQYNAAIRQSLGHLAMMRGESHKGVELFNEAQLLAPDDLTIVEDLLHAQVAAKQYANAEYNARKLLASDQYKDRRDLLLLQARCLLNIDRPVEARSILIGLTNDAQGAKDFEAWVDLGHACIILDDKVRLKNVASRMIATSPDRWEGHFMRALYYKMDGNIPAALEAVEGAVARSTDDANPLMLKGMMLQDQGKADEARQAFGKAVALQPDRSAARQLLNASNGAAAIVSGEPSTPSDR